MELPFVVYSILKQCWSVGYVNLLNLSFSFKVWVSKQVFLEIDCISFLFGETSWKRRLTLSFIERKKMSFKKLLTNFDPWFKWPAPFVWYQKKGLVISNLFCSRSVQEFFISFEIWLKVFFRGRPHYPLMGPFREIMESAYYLERQSMQHLFNNAISNIFCFPAISVQNYSWLAPNFPNYVIYALHLHIYMRDCLKLNNFCSTCLNKIWRCSK